MQKEKFHANLLAYGMWAIVLIVLTGAMIELWGYVTTEPKSSQLFVGDMIGAIAITATWFGFFYLLKLFPPYAISITPDKIQLDYVFRKRTINCNQIREIVNSGFLMREREVILKDGENIAIGMVSKKELEKMKECAGNKKGN